ncbi:unnamed protein product [Ectocarpus sp. CCAP 1310/34]|nr:unnamed protein product [Ectocarpus sp. CCAP 1310/34]
MEQIRVKNGYGFLTSTLSASVIGDFDASSEKRKAANRVLNQKYDTDAAFQMSQLQGNHPVRKVLHMQKCYPETVFRLNRQGRTHKPDADRPISGRWHRNLAPNNCNTSVATQQRHRRPQSSLQAGRSVDGGLELSGNTTRRRGGCEYHFCRDKMAYYRAKGREAEVDGILTGTSPLDKRLPLFPAKATHQQLLGLVHRPTHPDKPAPAVPRERKWLGDNVGWEGNRGMATPPAGRNAKDGEVHPWPSSQYPLVLPTG